MCGPLAGLSGGDMHALRLVAAWNRRGRALLVAPESIRRHIDPELSPVLVSLRTPADRFLRGLVSYVFIVVLRTLRACLGASAQADTAIAASHFIHDVVPCAVHRRRHGSQASVYVYHLVADMGRAASLRSIVSRAGERLSVALIRRTGALVFVDNEETRRSLLRHGIDSSRIIDTENAYDPVDGMPPRVEPQIATVAFCGRFVEEKGIWDMLELARRLSSAAPDARIIMLGDGPLRERFLAAVREAALTNLDAPGFASESEKWRLLRSATLFAAPSSEEGWGIAVGEALIAGLPVVLYDLPAYAHFGALPIRVPVADRERFIETVVSLVESGERLACERQRVEAGAASLPRWPDVLAREIDAMSDRRRTG